MISQRCFSLWSLAKKKKKNPKSRFHIQGHRDGGGRWMCHGCDAALTCPSFEAVGCGTSLLSGIPHAFLIHSSFSSLSRPDTGTGIPTDSPVPGFLGFPSFRCKTGEKPNLPSQPRVHHQSRDTSKCFWEFLQDSIGLHLLGQERGGSYCQKEQKWWLLSRPMKGFFSFS